MLKAASYGKRFLDGYSTAEFVDVCRKLRALNCVRKAAVGMPLTFAQMDRLTPQVVVDRLAFR
jgi:hypothetical protein